LLHDESFDLDLISFDATELYGGANRVVLPAGGCRRMRPSEGHHLGS
jgi:hypothetical protein